MACSWTAWPPTSAGNLSPVPPPPWLTDARTSYDTVARSYADTVRGTVARHPYLRAALTLLADEVRESDAPVADVGCGPGHVTAHLNLLGANTFGLDISPAMIDVARRDHPRLRFLVGSMTGLPLATGSLAGLLSWWTLIHVPDDAIPLVFHNFHRVLRQGAPVHLAFHTGDEVKLRTTGHGDLPMHVRVHRRPPARVAGWLTAAGFTVDAELHLNGASPAAILFARRP